ncbi:MAG: pantetheine-phosphate adenylyltransferase [Nostocoides sp.]
MSTRRAVCPGSFDPVTLGHADIFRRAAVLFDELVIAVLQNPAKAGTFTVEERVAFVREVTADLPGVSVTASRDRLLVDLCQELDANVMIKGVRGSADYEYELPMAQMNRHLTGVETLFLPADPRFAHVSSSLIKEVVRYGGDVSGLVPEPVRQGLVDRLAP